MSRKRIHSLPAIAVLVGIALCLGAASCAKHDVYLRGATSMAAVKGDGYLTDEGLVLHVAEKTVETPYDAYKRAYIRYDVLSLRGEKEYDIRLVGIENVLTKDPVRASGLDEQADAELGRDPVTFTKAWIGGGYLNASVSIAFKQDSETAHRLSLVFRDDLDHSDTLRFELRHNGFGEVLQEGSANEGILVGNALASFNMAGLWATGKEHMNIKVTSTWYDYEDGQYKATTHPVRFRGNL